MSAEEQALEETMEIDGNNRLVPLSAGIQRLDAKPQGPRPLKDGEESARPGSESDRIELSVRGLQVHRMDDWIRSTPDVREARVEQVRSAIANGTYNVKAELIAEKIIGGSLIDDIF